MEMSRQRAFYSVYRLQLENVSSDLNTCNFKFVMGIKYQFENKYYNLQKASEPIGQEICLTVD